MAVLFSKLSSLSLAELREVLELCLQVAILTPRCYYGSPIIFLDKEGLSKQFLCTAAASCPLLTTRGQYVLSNAPSSRHGRLQRHRDRRQLHTCSSCSQEAPGRREGRETWPAVFVQLHSPVPDASMKCISSLHGTSQGWPLSNPCQYPDFLWERAKT